LVQFLVDQKVCNLDIKELTRQKTKRRIKVIEFMEKEKRIQNKVDITDKEVQRDKLIYEIVSDRYKQELRITIDLDSKANNVIGFSGLLATLIVAITGYLPKGDYQALFVVPVILLIFSAIEGLRAYWIKPYKAIEPENFVKEYKNKSTTEILRDLYATTAYIINKNNEINRRRATWIKYASTLLVLAIGIFFAFGIINWLL
jgi:hypothetical protein